MHIIARTPFSVTLTDFAFHDMMTTEDHLTIKLVLGQFCYFIYIELHRLVFKAPVLGYKTKVRLF